MTPAPLVERRFWTAASRSPRTVSFDGRLANVLELGLAGCLAVEEYVGALVAAGRRRLRKYSWVKPTCCWTNCVLDGSACWCVHQSWVSDVDGLHVAEDGFPFTTTWNDRGLHVIHTGCEWADESDLTAVSDGAGDVARAWLPVWSTPLPSRGTS